MHVRIVTGTLVALTLLQLTGPDEVKGQAAAGVIEGTLALGLGPPRKTASRYPGRGSSTNDMQRVPAVVYLTGEALRAAPITAAVDMLQRDTAFDPAVLAIQAGTVVRFPNADPFFHNVFSYAGSARFDLGRYPEGESREFRFERVKILLLMVRQLRNYPQPVVVRSSEYKSLAHQGLLRRRHRSGTTRLS